jgi:hypothetical protein
MTDPSIEAWLDSLPEEVIQREMDEWEARMRQANIEYSKRREILELKRRWRESYGVSFEERGSEDKPESTLFPERPSSIRESVLQVMVIDPLRIWNTRELTDALVERGWMENDEKSVRSLQSALSRMQAEGLIIRVRHGHYKSVASVFAEQAAAEQALSEQGADTD